MTATRHAVAVPSGDAAPYPAREGSSFLDERRAAPSRPAVLSGDGAPYPAREVLR